LVSLVAVFIFVRYQVAKKKRVSPETTTELEMEVPELPENEDFRVLSFILTSNVFNVLLIQFCLLSKQTHLVLSLLSPCNSQANVFFFMRVCLLFFSSLIDLKTPNLRPVKKGTKL